MTRDPVFIRVDATPKTGYERLARCLTLAAALQRRRRPVYFVSQLDPPSLVFSIKRGGNEWIDACSAAASEEDATEVIQEIRRRNPAAVIVDDANASQEYLTDLGAAGPLMVSIDHSAQIRFPSQVVVNPLLAPSRDAYEFFPGTQLLLGQRYALVRPEIRRLRPARAQEPAPLMPPNGKGTAGQFRALLALGEDDSNELTLSLVKTVLSVPRLAKVDAVVRPSHPQLDALKTLAEGQEGKLEIAVEPGEVATRVARCHFAISSGSGWSLELACVGVPQLLIVQSEQYWPTAQRLEEEGCATCLGSHDNVSPATIRNAIATLLSDPLERQAMARCGRQLIDSRGPDRFVTALEVMLHPSRLVDFTADAA